MMAMAATCRAVGLLLAVATLSFVPALLASDDCVFTIYVRTGSIWKGGTDSVIGATIYDASGYHRVAIPDIVTWGGSVQGKDRDYFERGSLDIFSGLGKCLDQPICALNLTSDGTGDGHGWYVNYVEVTFTGAHLECNQHLFTVERWLATDAYPYTLNAEVNECAGYEARHSAHALSSVITDE